MKKPLLFCTLYFVLCIGATFAYTSDDLANANSLADQQIIMKQTVASKYGLDNKILRQEVIGMALKVKGITLPDNYTCKKYFADATKNDWVCRAVELAADNGIITRSNKSANPGKYVTRAEAFIMMYNASGIVPFRELAGFQILDKDAVSWQKDLFQRIHDSEISMPGEKYMTSNTPAIPVYFYPNRSATRAEVFGFTKNILVNTLTENTKKYANAIYGFKFDYPESLSFQKITTPFSAIVDGVESSISNKYLVSGSFQSQQTIYIGKTPITSSEECYIDTENYIGLANTENGYSFSKFKIQADCAMDTGCTSGYYYRLWENNKCFEIRNFYFQQDCTKYSNNPSACTIADNNSQQTLENTTMITEKIVKTFVPN